MGLMAQVVRELVSAGLDGAAIADAIERIEAAAGPVRTARQDRNARYYDRKVSEKRLKASEQDAAKEAPHTPQENTPLPPTSPTGTTGVSPQGERPPSKTKRGSRIPDGFEPLEIDVQRARGWGLSDDEIRFEHEKFTDFWRSKAGASATKADWDGTWRNWMRRAADEKRNRQAGKFRREG